MLHNRDSNESPALRLQAKTEEVRSCLQPRNTTFIASKIRPRIVGPFVIIRCDLVRDVGFPSKILTWDGLHH